MPKKSAKPSEHIKCANCGRTLLLRGPANSGYAMPVPSDVDASKVHRVSRSAEPHGTVMCPGCGHYTSNV